SARVGVIFAFIQDDPDPHATTGRRGQVTLGRAVGELIHGDVHTVPGPFDQVVDGPEPAAGLGDQRARPGPGGAGGGSGGRGAGGGDGGTTRHRERRGGQGGHGRPGE